jgi:hypothetical protein
MAIWLKYLLGSGGPDLPASNEVAQGHLPFWRCQHVLDGICLLELLCAHFHRHR